MEFDDVRKLSSFLVKLEQLKNKSYKTQDPIENSEEQNVQTSRTWSQKEKEMHYLQKCLQGNQDCYSNLTLIESSINILLESCVKEQKIINEKLNVYIRKGPKNSFRDGRYRQLGKTLYMPYFKTVRGFSHPYNEDVSKRNVQGFLNQYDVPVPRLWKKCEESVVTQYIRKVEEDKWTDTLASCGMLHMANVKQMSFEELVESRYDEYDWLNISVSLLNNAHSPEECRVLWFTCLHPLINQQEWSEKENKKLISLVKQHKGQDWDGIAQELGTKRTGFQCIRHFKENLSGMYNRKWTESEIVSLKTWVKVLRYKKFVPWYHVQKFMDGRDLIQIYRVWNKIHDEGKPLIFSLEEDILLVAGMKLFGCDYPRIQDHLPERTVQQVHRRVQILKCRQFPNQPWSVEEDKLLRKLVDKYGVGSWLQISMHLVNRTNQNVQRRYHTLQMKNMHKGNKSPAGYLRRSPMQSADVVTISLLWEFVVTICQENKICDNLDNLDENQSVNVIHKLSQLLKPKMRIHRTVPENDLRPLLDKEYYRFFKGAYLQNEDKNRTERKKSIHSLVYDITIALKLLEAKIQVPVIKEVETDTALSSQDKYIVKHLVKVSKRSECSDVFLARTGDRQTIISGENPSTNSGNICYVFPPNVSSVIAMRSLLLNNQNLKEQKEGLTMQVDNFELKEMNTLCPPRELRFGENYNVAGKLWNERMDKLLGGVALILNRECDVLHF